MARKRFLLPAIVHKYIDNLFTYAVEGDPGQVTVRLLKRILRLRPYSYMLFCYRAGQIQNAVQAFGKKPSPADYYLGRIWRRCHEMLGVLENGFPLPEPAVNRKKWHFNNRVLFVFHSAESYDPAGYTVRSNAILRSMASRNIAACACTRLGYPWDLPQHQGKAVVASSKEEGFTIRHFHDPDSLIGDADSRYLNAYADKLESLALEENVSVIHASSNFLNGIAAAMAARRLGLKSVYEMRGLWHLTRSLREKDFDRTEHFQYCEKMEITAAMACDHVVTISNPLKEWLISAGVAAEKIHVIPNAAEMDADNGEECQPPPGLQYLNEKFVVGFIGSLTGYEGIDLIIRAVGKLTSKIPDIHCLIVGDGRERAELEALTAELGLKRIVTFTGRIPRSQISAYYRLIDVFPLPRKPVSVCRLVPPLKPLEIMAREKPVIVSDLPPLTEMIIHGTTGLVCKTDSVDSLAESIRLIQSDPHLATELGANGRHWVIDYRTWHHNAVLYKLLYLNLSEEISPDGTMQ